MRKLKRILVTLITFLLCMAVFLPYAGAEIIFFPQTSQLISGTNVYAEPKGSGRIDTTATITTRIAVDTLGFSYIRLQELRDGSWVTVKSVSSKYVTNALTYTYVMTYYGTPGMSYRAQAGFSATDSGINETRSSTSGSMTCE